MSLEKAKKYLEGKGCLDHVIEPEVAAGNDHSAVKLTLPELEEVCNAQGWVDVCKTPEGRNDTTRCIVGADACIDPYSVTGMNH